MVNLAVGTLTCEVWNAIEIDVVLKMKIHDDDEICRHADLHVEERAPLGYEGKGVS